MNKTLLSVLLFASVISTLQAQIYTPGGTIQGNTGTNNVGIGTNAPQAKLSIVPSANHITGGQPTLRICEATGNENYGLGLSTYYNGFMYVGKLQQFHSGTPSDILVNPEGGNVGIGTSNPIAKLHVEGDTYLGTNQLQFLSASGGNNRIQSFGGLGTFGTWLIKSRFDNIVIDAGENTGNGRKIVFKIGGEDKMLLDSSGNFGIGTTTPTSKLTVAGNIHSREVKVTVDAGADFVFEKDYNLPSLDSVDNYIKENKHLPQIASAKEMQTNGINLSEMNIKLLQKVEELTLYVIEQNKKIEIQQTEITKQSKEIIILKEVNESYKVITERISKLENQLKN